MKMGWILCVANTGSNNVTVIDGATNSTSTVSVGNTPTGMAVNSVTNKIYVTNNGSSNVTVIDAANSNATSTVSTVTNPYGVVVNPVTNRIYVGKQQHEQCNGDLRREQRHHHCHHS